MSLTVSVDSKALRTVLDRVISLMDDMSPIMSAVGMEMETRISGRFETQSDPLGVAWMPWQSATVNSYPKGGNNRLLDRFGDMLDSVNHQFDSNSVLIGFGDPKAAYHEWGTKRMERRGLLFDDPDAGTLAPADEAALLDVVVDVLNRTID